jgi:hypothetical protein
MNIEYAVLKGNFPRHRIWVFCITNFPGCVSFLASKMVTAAVDLQSLPGRVDSQGTVRYCTTGCPCTSFGGWSVVQVLLLRLKLTMYCLWRSGQLLKGCSQGLTSCLCAVVKVVRCCCRGLTICLCAVVEAWQVVHVLLLRSGLWVHVLVLFLRSDKLSMCFCWSHKRCQCAAVET